MRRALLEDRGTYGLERGPKNAGRRRHHGRDRPTRGPVLPVIWSLAGLSGVSTRGQVDHGAEAQDGIDDLIDLRIGHVWRPSEG